jgi:hypothetical protein
MSQDLPLFDLWTRVLAWILAHTEKFPKSARFTFSSRIDNLALDILELIVEARYSSRKIEKLRSININLEKLRVLLRICHDRGYLDHRAYEYAGIQLWEAGKMVGGWLKQQRENRKTPQP